MGFLQTQKDTLEKLNIKVSAYILCSNSGTGFVKKGFA